jgi:hypothetical protein
MPRDLAGPAIWLCPMILVLLVPMRRIPHCIPMRRMGTRNFNSTPELLRCLYCRVKTRPLIGEEALQYGQIAHLS